ncbi:hypothetical protein RF11_05374 [Thelohanellus kitauei]|uniref:Uncharacterized protein n=1 Tax=Thelohanellus kitauei TaxID=669202 RepID=A0A0C2JXH4_THEKT|nr:hypothetical protein RF11_05374 [Thelohanellus kitauei]
MDLPTNSFDTTQVVELLKLGCIYESKKGGGLLESLMLYVKGNTIDKKQLDSICIDRAAALRANCRYVWRSENVSMKYCVEILNLIDIMDVVLKCVNKSRNLTKDGFIKEIYCHLLESEMNHRFVLDLN